MAITKIPSAGFQDNVKFRNIIINGDMSIAQRSTSTSSISSSSTYQTIDRIKTHLGSLGTWTQSQSTTVPSGQGFATSLKMDCTSTGSAGTSGYLHLTQQVEGQNLQYLKKGTSSAKSLTLSFWVKSNKTGTYICELQDEDNTRANSQSYTISSADTWEKKTLTFPGDTTGAFGNDANSSLSVNFWLGAGTNLTSGTLQTSWGSLVTANRAVGQVNLADSTSNEWYITGVQLEAGTSASDFEFLPVDVNLQRCQRYYYSHVNGNNQNIANGFYYNASYITTTIFFPVEMRTAPSLVKTSGTSYYKAWSNNSYDLFDDFNDGIQSPTNYCAGMDASTAVGGTLGNGNRIITNNANALLAFNSEL